MISDKNDLILTALETSLEYLISLNASSDTLLELRRHIHRRRIQNTLYSEPCTLQDKNDEHSDCPSDMQFPKDVNIRRFRDAYGTKEVKERDVESLGQLRYNNHICPSTTQETALMTTNISTYKGKDLLQNLKIGHATCNSDDEVQIKADSNPSINDSIRKLIDSQLKEFGEFDPLRGRSSAWLRNPSVNEYFQSNEYYVNKDIVNNDSKLVSIYDYFDPKKLRHGRNDEQNIYSTHRKSNREDQSYQVQGGMGKACVGTRVPYFGSSSLTSIRILNSIHDWRNGYPDTHETSSTIFFDYGIEIDEDLCEINEDGELIPVQDTYILIIL